MKPVDNQILEFIFDHHVLTLATTSNNQPWCCSCFYAYLKEENLFVFTSDLDTRHGKEAILNQNVAANIVLETKTVGKIQGLQIEGILRIPEDGIEKKVKKAYLKRFPYAALMKTKLWILTPGQMKMTDNRLGFGKKLIWSKE